MSDLQGFCLDSRPQVEVFSFWQRVFVRDPARVERLFFEPRLAEALDAEAFALKRGVCQDLTHIFIAAARSLLDSLETNAEPRDREVEAARARARSLRRFNRGTT